MKFFESIITNSVLDSVHHLKKILRVLTQKKPEMINDAQVMLQNRCQIPVSL